jgi:hypothetical protein
VPVADFVVLLPPPNKPPIFIHIRQSKLANRTSSVARFMGEDEHGFVFRARLQPSFTGLRCKSEASERGCFSFREIAPLIPPLR